MPHRWDARAYDVRLLMAALDYDYSAIDSTKLADWLRGLHELFVDVRVRGGGTLFPVHSTGEL